MTDAAGLEAAAKVLLNRADDLHYLGQEIVRRGTNAQWECAKAERFRDAMAARQTECRRLAVELRELGRAVRARSMSITPTGLPEV
jgi:uncharacterized protein YukE